MTKILVVADVHGELESLAKFVKAVENEPFDMIIFPGDFTEMSNVPEGFSQTDIAELVLQKLLSLGKPLFCVPGNHEPYETLETLEEYDVNLHKKVRKFRDLDLMGFGGAATPFNTKFEPTEGEIAHALEDMKKNAGKRFILVTHNPPKDTKLDRTESGQHVGSLAIRTFVEKYKPLLAVSAHIHEAGGSDRLGETALFYPGPLYEGFYGIAAIGKSSVKCEIRKF